MPTPKIRWNVPTGLSVVGLKSHFSLVRAVSSQGLGGRESTPSLQNFNSFSLSFCVSWARAIVKGTFSFYESKAGWLDLRQRPCQGSVNLQAKGSPWNAPRENATDRFGLRGPGHGKILMESQKWGG